MIFKSVSLAALLSANVALAQGDCPQSATFTKAELLKVEQKSQKKLVKKLFAGKKGTDISTLEKLTPGKVSSKVSSFDLNDVKQDSFKFKLTLKNNGKLAWNDNTEVVCGGDPKTLSIPSGTAKIGKTDVGGEATVEFDSPVKVGSDYQFPNKSLILQDTINCKVHIQDTSAPSSCQNISLDSSVSFKVVANKAGFNINGNGSGGLRPSGGN